MKRLALSVRGLALLALVAPAVLATSCATDPDAQSKIGETTPQELRPAIAPEIVSAMQRDLRLDQAGVMQRLAAEWSAARLEPSLRDRLGDAFAGAWMDDRGSRLQVGITDAALADAVRAAGAEPQLVARSLAQLESVKARLDDGAARAGADIHAWHVDPASNTVVVQTADPDAAATRAFVASLGLGDGAAVRLVASAERPRPLYDLRGGDEYIINSNTLCSIGFAVNGGFVTAGHCGRAGSPTAGSNWVAQGTFQGSTFPGNDFAWVSINGDWHSLPWVNNYAGGVFRIVGSQVASLGSSICRSGRTSGLRCGVVQAYNVTVNYAAGPVYGLTQTNACAEGGDSGGSFFSGVQAQGTTSGGSGNCSTGGTTFYQPVNPTLANYGLTLKTDGAIGSRMNNKCIDVPGANFVDGAQLQMYTCNGTGAQRWIYSDGTLQAGGKCMDVAWANPADGTAVQLVGCNGNRAQQFVLTGAGDLVSVLANKCVDIAGWNGSDGARLIIWPCHGGANQKWYRF